MKILNFGSLNVDHVYQVESIVRPGQTISSKNLSFHSGGKGLNQSVAAAKSGADVYHAGASSKNDNYILKDVLEKHGVNTDFIDTEYEISGHAVIQVDSGGQNCILLYGGANQEIDEDFAKKVLSNFGKEDILLLQNEISCMPYIIKLAKQQGLEICFNPSPVNDKLKSYPIELVDTLILNEIEGEELTGEKDEEKIIEALLKDYSDMKIVLTLGQKGVIFADKTTRIKRGIFKVDVVDTTAAGDTFTGYYITVAKNTNDYEKALLYASAASAIAVSRSGAAESIPTMKEVEQFIKDRNL